MSNKRSSSANAPLAAYSYEQGTRTNLPTDQTERYMDEEDLKSIPYSPECRAKEGPRLSWRRGNSLDDMETAAGPLFIHEKVSPTAFARHLTQDSGTDRLFEAFNDLPPDAAFACYKYKGNWSNRIIKGHSENVMASLAAREGLAGKVQMIYWDPPYGISYNSNFQPSTRKRASGPPTSGASTLAFRDTYREGIHSYLDAVYRTAVHGRALLNDTGSFFLQISSSNVHRLALVLDEAFGAGNRVATIAFAKTSASSAKTLPEVCDYLLWYAKDKSQIKFHQLYEPLTRAEKIDHMTWHAMVELVNGKTRRLTPEERSDPDTNLPEGARVYRRMRLASMQESTTGRSRAFTWNGQVFPCPPGEHWRVSHSGLERLAELGRLDAASEVSYLSWKRYENEVPGRPLNNVWHQQNSPSDMHYVVETAESVIERCILMATDPGDLVLDPTCGSGTTAFVAEKWGRRWITIDASPVPIALCRQRIIAAVHDWYLTRDDPDGWKAEAALRGRTLSESDTPPSGQPSDPHSGFVYERVPRVSAAVLAYDRPVEPILLVDQPKKKRGWKRLSAAFTVESHSPWRYEPVIGGQGESELRQGVRARMLEALGRAGFPAEDNGSGERWHLDDIESWPESQCLTHEARIRETGERVALSLLSDDQTATVAFVDRAAEEAAGRRAIKRLLVCAFEFDSDAYDSRQERRGRLQIVKLRSNRDLAVAELKPGDRDRAFVLVGEPELDVRLTDNGMVEVEVLGWNTYDPASGGVSSGQPEEVDCWLLDTDHDGKSFFARRIHFPGRKDDPQLKRFRARLGARIHPDRWKTMGSLVSAPFNRPTTGRIAVRIVTSTGDEMLAVRDVPTPSAR